MENQQVEDEGTLGQMDDTMFRRRYGTEWALLDEREGEVVYAVSSDTKELGEYALLPPYLLASRRLLPLLSALPNAPGALNV